MLDGSPSSLFLGKASIMDQITLNLVMMGCGQTRFSLTATFFSNGTDVTAEVSTSSGTTTDGSGLFFADYVSFFASYGLDNLATFALRMAVDTQG
jgi:hypothetical protein